VGIRIAGIQPGYLAWLGYFDQMLRVDAFVVADQMPYTSSGWTHRNRVRGPHGPHWLTLPARPAHGQRIHEVALEPTVDWRRKHLRTLRHFYASSPHAGAILERLAATLDPDATRLVDVSTPTVRLLAELLGIETPILVSSEHGEHGLEGVYRASFPDQPSPTHRIIAYMQALGATELLEGESGQAYMDLDLCSAHGITVTFQRYRHPVYTQLHEPFVSHLSALDLLLCRGASEARRVLQAAAEEPT